jgi:hypothetical protein
MSNPWPKFDPSAYSERDLRIAATDALGIAQAAANLMHSMVDRPDIMKLLPDDIFGNAQHLISLFNECDPQGPLLRMAQTYCDQLNAWKDSDRSPS